VYPHGYTILAGVAMKSIGGAMTDQDRLTLLRMRVLAGGGKTLGRWAASAPLALRANAPNLRAGQGAVPP
jgi:hypothetical protein